MNLIKLDENRWIIGKTGKMNVEGIIYSNSKMMEQVKSDNAFNQVANVATLPGIVSKSIAMPDIHWGYGFPIGGVAAFDLEKGIISPGGIGYDINCGMRLIKTSLRKIDIEQYLEKLIYGLFSNIPAGVGQEGKIRLSEKEVKEVLLKGSLWALKTGYGEQIDIDNTEDFGQMNSANPENVSKRAIERGMHQLGTLGSGNHFLEIQEVDEIYDENIAKSFGLFKGQITIMFHTGSRGLGYQVCDDYIKIMLNASNKYGIYLADKQLASAPIKSIEGQKYFSAMSAAANYAWANRQIIFFWIKETFEKIMGQSSSKLGIKQLYDIAHNIGKIEEHILNEKKVKLLVHRKGATRAFASGNVALQEHYRETGQPVIVPGTMGTASYVLVGTKKAQDETFGSTCHGAGRMMSIHEAIKAQSGSDVFKRIWPDTSS